MASKESKECFLTEHQREMMKIASMNVENSAPVPSKILSSSPKGLASSPKSNSSFLSDHHAKGGGKAPVVRHVRRTHSGKPVKVKKGEYSFVNGASVYVIVYSFNRFGSRLIY